MATATKRSRIPKSASRRMAELMLNPQQPATWDERMDSVRALHDANAAGSSPYTPVGSGAQGLVAAILGQSPGLERLEAPSAYGTPGGLRRGAPHQPAMSTAIPMGAGGGEPAVNPLRGIPSSGKRLADEFYGPDGLLTEDGRKIVRREMLEQGRARQQTPEQRLAARLAGIERSDQMMTSQGYLPLKERQANVFRNAQARGEMRKMRLGDMLPVEALGGALARSGGGREDLLTLIMGPAYGAAQLDAQAQRDRLAVLDRQFGQDLEMRREEMRHNDPLEVRRRMLEDPQLGPIAGETPEQQLQIDIQSGKLTPSVTSALDSYWESDEWDESWSPFSKGGPRLEVFKRRAMLKFGLTPEVLDEYLQRRFPGEHVPGAFVESEPFPASAGP